MVKSLALVDKHSTRAFLSLARVHQLNDYANQHLIYTKTAYLIHSVNNNKKAGSLSEVREPFEQVSLFIECCGKSGDGFDNSAGRIFNLYFCVGSISVAGRCKPIF